MKVFAAFSLACAAGAVKNILHIVYDDFRTDLPSEFPQHTPTTFAANL